jgi:hypothetical protein
VESNTSEEMLALAKRARRALTRWPLTELDPIERAELVSALRHARSFDDLAPGWQRLILESEAGRPRGSRDFYLHLRGDPSAARPSD